MATKRGGNVVQLVTLVFTTLIAPVLVQVIARGFDSDDGGPTSSAQTTARYQEPSRPCDSCTAAMPPPPFPPPAPVVKGSQVSATPPAEDLIEVIVDDAGRTSAEALQQALHTALSRALAAQLDERTPSRTVTALLDDVWNHRDAVIRRWKILGATKHWKLTGAVYHVQVAVELDRRSLWSRLGAAGSEARRAGGP
jgi:hypothetical protein